MVMVKTVIFKSIKPGLLGVLTSATYELRSELRVFPLSEMQETLTLLHPMAKISQSQNLRS